MKKSIRGGELVVKILEEFGAKVVFGVPGGQTLFVTDPLQNTNIRFVHTRHENGAACAADGWGRLTGEPGICLATTGPGATNLITGIGGAYRDSSPMIALVFQNKLPDVGRGDAQECNHERVFESICKKCQSGEVSTRRAAELLGVSHTTFYRRYKKIIAENVSNSRHFGTSE